MGPKQALGDIDLDILSPWKVSLPSGAGSEVGLWHMTDSDDKILIGRVVAQELAEFERIDAAAFSTPWPAAEFNRFMELDEYVLLAARAGERSVGYGVVLYDKGDAHLIKLAVDEPWRRKGIGTLLLSELARTATEYGALTVTLEVRETNLAAQLFYRECGLRAVRIERDFYADTGEDAYVMEKPLSEVAHTNGQSGGFTKT